MRLADNKMLNSRWRNTVIALLLGLVVVVLAEVVVFNAPYWQTRNANPIEISKFGLGSGISQEGKSYIVQKDSEKYIEVDSNQLIRYVYIDFAGSDQVDYGIVVQQQGTQGWFNGGVKHSTRGDIDDSKYIRIENNSKRIRLELQGGIGSRISISKVIVNPNINFSFDVERLMLLLCCMAFVILFRPGSPIYRIRLKEVLTIRSGEIWAIVLLTFVQVAILGFVWHIAGGSDPIETWPKKIFAFQTDYDQYARLGDALIHGHTYIDLPVSDALRNMDNPYDPDLRSRIVDDSNPVYWDHAFYQGRYFSYFGVVPAILMYVPYQLLTGAWLKTTWAVLMLSVLSVVLISFFIFQISRTYYKESANLGIIMLAIIACNIGSSIYYQVYTANFYSVPGVCSLSLTLASLSLWLLAKRRNISKPLIAIGSTCMALNLGSRPQFILASILALPIFWNELMHERLFFSRKGLANTVAAFFPFFFVFVPLLAYNQIRFGSFFDFGAAYNLTGFDMTEMEFPMQDLLPMLFYFLLQPLNLNFTFPFVNSVSTPLPAWFPAEVSPGGLFMLCPFFFFAFILPIIIKKRGLLRNVLPCIAALLCLVIMYVDIVTCGLAWRYYLDFAWLICIIFIFVVMELGCDLLESSSTKLISINYLQIVLSILFVLVLVSSLNTFNSWFMPSRQFPMIVTNPSMYFRVAKWFIFLS